MRYSKIELTGLDIDWFAVDSMGQIAQFASSGSVLIPENVLKSKEMNERVTSYILDALEPSSDFRLFELWKRFRHESAVALGNSPDCWDSFIEFAELGLYSYDCVCRGSVGEKGPYYLVAAPTNPLQIEDFPKWVRGFLCSTLIEGSFKDRQILSKGDIGLEVCQPREK